MQQRPELKKAIGGFGFFTLALGSMIGVGWITGLKGMFTNAGPLGTIVAFLLGGGLMMLIGTCYADAMRRIPVTGGEVAYAYRAFGASKSFIVGWCLALGYLFVSAFEAVSIGIVVSYLVNVDYWPLYEFNGSTVYGSHLLLAALLTGLLAWMNHRGVSLASGTQTLLTLLLLGSAILFISVGFAKGSPTHLEPGFGNGGKGLWTGILMVFVTTPFWFVGFDTIPQVAEERKEGVSPGLLGRMLILAILGSTLFYVFVFLSAGMAAPWTDIIDDPLPTARAFEKASSSLLWARLVLLVGLVGLLTSWNGFFLSASRVIFALGRARIINPVFGRPHPVYGTPTASILFCGLVTFLGALLGKQAVLLLVNVGSLFIAVAFLGVAFSLFRIRGIDDRLTGLRGRLVPVLAGFGAGLILLMMLYPGSPVMLAWPTEWIILGFFVLAGMAFWFSGTQSRNAITEKEREELMLGSSAPAEKTGNVS